MKKSQPTSVVTGAAGFLGSHLTDLLVARGHKVEIMSRYNNGAAPVMIRLLPGGTIEAGADPFYNRSARAR